MYTAYLLWDGPDVGEAFTEDDKHSTGPTAEGRGRTIKRRVTSTKDYHVAMEIREGALAGTHTCRERERERGEGRKGDLTIGTKNLSDILGPAQKGT